MMVLDADLGLDHLFLGNAADTDADLDAALYAFAAFDFGTDVHIDF